MLEELHKRVYDTYKTDIGKTRDSLITPALLLDIDIAKRNISFLSEKMKTLHAKLRPHIKCQKCVKLAQMQIEAGSIGVCAATVWEAAVMSASGINDVLIVNEVGGTEKIRALAAAAGKGRLTAVVDSEINAGDLSSAAKAAGSRLELLIEVDVGMGRGGVRSKEQALALARHLSKLPNVRLRGVQGYEGHCMHETDRAVKTRKVKEALAVLHGTVELLEKNGFKCEVVSSGGTGTYDITGADSLVTEIQAGSYVFMDVFHGKLTADFRNSLTVLATVAIKQGDTIVLDAGRKSIGVDLEPAVMLQYPSYPARGFAEEHGIFDMDAKCKLKLGDRVDIIPGYAPSTVNMYDAYHVTQKGVVVDIWPVIPRGPGHLGIPEIVAGR